MRVRELWRHPVKSMQGEALAEVSVEPNGVAHDRLWGVRENATGSVLTGRRQPPLLLARARLHDGEPHITLPDGSSLSGTGPVTDDALSRWLGTSVSLVDAREQPPADAQFFADATNDASELVTWTMPAGRFVDALPLLIITTASLRAGAALHPGGAWDVRRFRPNIVVDADGDDWLEDSWVGRDVRIGDVVVKPVAPCTRCTMVTRQQPGLDRDVDIFKTLARAHAATYGVWAQVVTPGSIRVGDAVAAGADQA